MSDSEENSEQQDKEKESDEDGDEDHDEEDKEKESDEDSDEDSDEVLEVRDKEKESDEDSDEDSDEVLEVRDKEKESDEDSDEVLKVRDKEKESDEDSDEDSRNGRTLRVSLVCVDEMQDWLKEQGLDSFKRRNITFEDFSKLTDQDFIDMGIAEQHKKQIKQAMSSIQLRKAAEEGNLEHVQELLAQRADVDSKWRGDTALHLAWRYGRIATTEVLVAAGGDLNEFPDIEEGMRQGVADCDVFILFLTNAVLSRPFCLKEMFWAIEFKKPFLVVLETDLRFFPFNRARWTRDELQKLAGWNQWEKATNLGSSYEQCRVHDKFKLVHDKSGLSMKQGNRQAHKSILPFPLKQTFHKIGMG
eukprot:g36900.t1